MNNFNLSAVINQCEFDFDKVSSIHFIDCPESIIQETAWNLFKEIRPVIHQYAPRFA